ncbi:hypothetical protein SAMN05216319_2322 [Duganella sp. CF402]|uniref:hypothetical protein n=1 Tax=unclassified Duganella TaxID=2636909 RepID=UPI0008D84C95|nr:MULTISPECIES: hypothetical protein [unclassified Duganella]RZT09254.1 hypothetical protein EV582_1298 [Duganella sp. BK701]SEL64531.1 hypothetical protein SAMN05216319_2322 [Duganella sp. CF402]
MNAKSCLPVLTCLLLAACTLNSPLPDDPAPPPAPPPVVEKLPAPPPPPDEIGPLLSYHQSLRRMSQGELLKELSGLGLQQRSPRVAIQMGMALMLTRGGGDLARAQSLLDSVATSAEPEAAPFRPLAQLLSSNCAETRRLAEHADKLAAQQKDSQRRIDQLNETLEALKAIERTLPVRPAPAPQGTR